MRSVKLFDIDIAKVGRGDFKVELQELLRASGAPVSIAKVNTEFLLRAGKSSDFKKALKGFSYRIADGKGVLWAAKYLSLPLTDKSGARQIQAIWQMIYSGASLIFYPRYCRSPIPENIPGVDAMFVMLEAAEETGAPVYFFGSEASVLNAAIDKIEKRFPHLRIAGFHAGFDFRDEEIVAAVNQSGAKLLVVALGSPKQEFWISDNLDKLAVRIAVGEGGTLDYVAGAYRRAPQWMQQASLEWFWRLFMNKNKSLSGSRAGRVWNAVPVFIVAAVRERLRQR